MSTRGRGRPRSTGTGTTVGVRLLPSLLAELDGWIARQSGPRPSRAEAVRSLAIASLASGNAVPAGRGSEIETLRAQNHALVILAEALRQRLVRQARAPLAGPRKRV